MKPTKKTRPKFTARPAKASPVGAGTLVVALTDVAVTRDPALAVAAESRLRMKLRQPKPSHLPGGRS
jgi:hypothetical protein